MQAATDVCNGGDTLDTLSLAKPPRRLQRSRSMEDLSTEQLNTTADTTVVVFLEYVRNKTSARPAKGHATSVDKERRQRKSAERSDKKGSLRRLQSEPNGPAYGRRRLNDKLRTRGPADGGSAGTEEPSPEGTPRPHRLLLEPPPSRAERKHKGQYKRTLSNTSTSSTDRESGHSSDATTPVPDPPLILSPCSHEHPDFVTTYPPPSKTLHRPRSVSSPIACPSQAIAGTPVSQDHLCHRQALTPPSSKDLELHRKHQAKLIAEKLKMYGDDLTDSHSQEELQRLSLALEGNANPEEVIRFFSAQLRHMLVGLSWQSIGKVFHLSYHLIELLTEILGPSTEINTGNPEWQQFSELWDFTLHAITRWIWSNGGWSAFLAADTTGGARSTSEQCPATPSFQRGSRRSRLLSLSESGEFVDEEGHPHTTSGTDSLHNGWCNGIEGKDSSVDQPQNQMEEAPLQSAHPSIPTCLPATITPLPVSPPCFNCTTNGSLEPEPRRKSHSLGEQSREAARKEREGDGEEEESQLSRSASLPTNALRRSSARRASETAFNGLVLGVSAACVYAAVSALMRH